MRKPNSHESQTKQVDAPVTWMERFAPYLGRSWFALERVTRRSVSEVGDQEVSRGRSMFFNGTEGPNKEREEALEFSMARRRCHGDPNVSSSEAYESNQ